MPLKKQGFFFVSIFFFILSPTTNGGELMGFLIKEKVYPFSGFEGQMLFKGEPAPGAKITRSYEHPGQNDRVEEVVIADDEGRFKFESVAVKYRRPLIATHEYLCDQDIYVEYQGEQYHVWSGGKKEKEEYYEFGGQKPENLTCEITGEGNSIKEADRLIFTTCNWENKK